MTDFSFETFYRLPDRRTHFGTFQKNYRRWRADGPRYQSSEITRVQLRAELFNQRNWIQGATHAVLSTWLKSQNTRQEAFRNLCAALTNAEMNHLAAELRTWVGGAIESRAISHDCKFEQISIHKVVKKMKRIFMIFTSIVSITLGNV